MVEENAFAEKAKKAWADFEKYYAATGFRLSLAQFIAGFFFVSMMVFLLLAFFRQPLIVSIVAFFTFMSIPKDVCEYTPERIWKNRKKDANNDDTDHACMVLDSCLFSIY